MKIKQIIHYIVAAVIGYLVVWELYSLLYSVIMIIIVPLFGELFYSVPLFILPIPGLLVLIIGAYLGVRSYRKRDIYSKVFKPGRKNILISFLISITFVAVAYMSSILVVIIPDSGMAATMNPFASIPVAILLYAYFFYPFSCLAEYYYRNRKERGFDEKRKIITLGILLNPIFIALSISIMILIGTWMTMVPCGVTYQGFLPDSAARDAGMNPQEVIVRMDEIDITDMEKMSNHLSYNQYNRTIRIQTMEGNEYFVTMRFNEQENQYMLGITNVANYLCRKDS